jgi:hypothetical protein
MAVLARVTSGHVWAGDRFLPLSIVARLCLQNGPDDRVIRPSPDLAHPTVRTA